MTYARGAHLVGSLAAANATEAFSQTASTLGHHLRRASDGETGPRSQWIWWQIDKLQAVPGIKLGDVQVNPDTGNPDYSVFPGLEVGEGVVIPPRALGYADAAIASYAEFVRLRTSGTIPAGVRFQVSIPTPFAVVVAWAAPAAQLRLWAPFKQALYAEVAAIQAEIPAEDLAIQWDVAVEIGALEAAFKPAPELAGYDRIVAELIDCARQVKPPAEVGFHLCYGDYKHRHFVAPRDLGLLVRIANDIAAAAPYQFVHMPVDRDNGLEAAYFAPLAKLAVGDAELSLGVIDYENDSARIDALVAAADSAETPYLVATECGMGRIGERGEPVTLADLLGQHARVAEPIR
ncbi:MAG TPA: hypothetical protein VKR24_12765 [Candidatus Limnocylindrales bacterium]|nr:hypothetical protein [Candidatus Limnocylindrales bacterium]